MSLNSHLGCLPRQLLQLSHHHTFSLVLLHAESSRNSGIHSCSTTPEEGEGVGIWVGSSLNFWHCHFFLKMDLHVENFLYWFFCLKKKSYRHPAKDLWTSRTCFLATCDEEFWTSTRTIPKFAPTVLKSSKTTSSSWKIERFTFLDFRHLEHLLPCLNGKNLHLKLEYTT